MLPWFCIALVSVNSSWVRFLTCLALPCTLGLLVPSTAFLVRRARTHLRRPACRPLCQGSLHQVPGPNRERRDGGGARAEPDAPAPRPRRLAQTRGKPGAVMMAVAVRSRPPLARAGAGRGWAGPVRSLRRVGSGCVSGCVRAVGPAHTHTRRCVMSYPTLRVYDGNSNEIAEASKRLNHAHTQTRTVFMMANRRRCFVVAMRSWNCSCLLFFRRSRRFFTLFAG